MKGKLKKELKSAFQAPPPTGKEQFLNQLRYPKNLLSGIPFGSA